MIWINKPAYVGASEQVEHDCDYRSCATVNFCNRLERSRRSSSFSEGVAAPYLDPGAIQPGNTDLIDKATYQAMRAFRRPFVTVHENCLLRVDSSDRSSYRRRCKIWYSISRRVSDGHASLQADRRSIRAFAVKPRAFGAPLCEFGA